ncbi:hypothetical protein C8Q74DRAFT_7468 [Fomes fomentarius]|nr:hypothetical protein C8Q74DRAFT_7468 [Fomes fomentarius]
MSLGRQCLGSLSRPSQALPAPATATTTTTASAVCPRLLFLEQRTLLHIRRTKATSPAQALCCARLGACFSRPVRLVRRVQISSRPFRYGRCMSAPFPGPSPRAPSTSPTCPCSALTIVYPNGNAGCVPNVGFLCTALAFRPSRHSIRNYGVYIWLLASVSTFFAGHM